MSNGGTPKGNSRSEQPKHDLAPARPTERRDDSHLMPGDERYHDDNQLMASLTDLNGQVARYVLRHLDREAGRVVATSRDDEHELGVQLTQAGLLVLERAERRLRSHGEH
jgi:hypothetical protein